MTLTLQVYNLGKKVEGITPKSPYSGIVKLDGHPIVVGTSPMLFLALFCFYWHLLPWAHLLAHLLWGLQLSPGMFLFVLTVPSSVSFSPTLGLWCMRLVVSLSTETSPGSVELRVSSSGLPAQMSLALMEVTIGRMAPLMSRSPPAWVLSSPFFPRFLWRKHKAYP